MSHLSRSQLQFEYSDVAVPGDDPKKTKEDATRFSRNESYEMITFINSFHWPSLDVNTVEDTNRRLKLEWVIRKKMPVTVQGRDKATEWVKKNYSEFSPLCPY